MNTHHPGSAASDSSDTPTAVPAADGGPVLSKQGLLNVIITPPPSSNSVIQTRSTNSQQGVVASTQPASRAGATPTGPSHPTPGSGVTLNGNNNNTLVGNTASHLSAPAPSVRVQTPLVSNGQAPATMSFSAGSPHVIKAEPPKTIIQTAASQQGMSPGCVAVPRNLSPAAVAASPGGMRTLTPQLLAPRLPQSSPGQPNIQNIQLPPGMVLVRSESGQLLMIHQQALAQMQAQAQQGAVAPRPATPTSMPAAHVPGTPIISRHVAPSSSVVRQGPPAAMANPPTTILHRPPVLQSSVGAALPGMTPGPGPPQAPGASSNETMENVKKCRNFLSTLIKLASTGNKSSETAANVKELVKELLEGKLEAEDFTSKLYRELNSSPQPYLVPFLKRSLPALRQLTPDAAVFTQQSHSPQPAPAAAAASTKPFTSGAAVLSSPGPRFAAPAPSPGISKPGQTDQMPQGAVMRPQVTVATPPVLTLRNQSPGQIMLGPQHLKQLQPGPPGRPAVLPVPKPVTPATLSAAQKTKQREAGGTFKDDDDINDVASMAGVNLTEESARILATNSELVGAVTRSCKDEAFLSLSVLQRRMLEIGKRFGVTELGGDVVTYTSHATQQRLQNLLEKVSHGAQLKNFNFKEGSNYEQSGDVRSQLRFFEQLEQLEKQRKEEQEREILLKAAKSRARQEDPEQLRLKQKAKEMQQQELALLRQSEANRTALAAIGTRKKRRLQDAAAASAAEGVGSSPSLLGGAGSSGSRPPRQRITRINLRDLLFCLENERLTGGSLFLYKGFLK